MDAPVDIASGLVPASDSGGPAATQVTNWRADASGANIPRPGLATYISAGLPASPVIGAYIFQSYLILVTEDRYLWRISSAAPTLAVALSTATATTQLDGSARPVFAEDASDVFVAGGGEVQKWTPGGATAVRLGGTAPLRVTHVANLGQRLVTNDTSDPTTKDEIFWSDAFDANDNVFNPLSVSNAEARTDDVRAIYENTSELFVFGESTLEVYGIGVDPTAPFERANAINLGISGIYSPTRIDESRFSLLDDQTRFVVTDGRSVEVISDAIESDIRAMSDPTDVWCFRRTADRFDELVCQFPSARRTLVYDLRTKRWTDDKYFENATQQPMPFGAYAKWPALGAHIYGSSLTAGGLYQLSTTARADLSNPLLCERTTGWHNHGSDKRKASSRVRAVIRRGTVTLGTTPGAVEFRVQNDGGAWSNWKQGSVGNAGDGYQTLDFYFGGVFRRRRYGIRYAGADDTAVISVVDMVEERAS